jgi:hypothetical protein
MCGSRRKEHDRGVRTRGSKAVSQSRRRLGRQEGESKAGRLALVAFAGHRAVRQRGAERLADVFVRAWGRGRYLWRHDETTTSAAAYLSAPATRRSRFVGGPLVSGSLGMGSTAALAGDLALLLR